MTPSTVVIFVENEAITLTRSGIWLSNGQEITHETTCQLFFRSLKRDADGWFLSVAHESKRITVEDTAYFILRIDGSPEDGFELLVSDGSREPLDPATLRYSTGRLVCCLQSGEEARFLHASYMDLLRTLDEGPDGYSLTIQGKRHLLAPR